MHPTLSIHHVRLIDLLHLSTRHENDIVATREREAEDIYEALSLPPPAIYFPEPRTLRVPRFYLFPYIAFGIESIIVCREHRCSAVHQCKSVSV